MTININGINSSHSSHARGKEKLQGTANETHTSSGASATGTTAKTERTDQVKLSPQVKTLQELEAKLAGFPDVNPEKIELIRQALREGDYQVDPARLAAKIVKFELDI